MESLLSKFSSRVDLVCRMSNPTQPVHFLSLSRALFPPSCCICGSNIYEESLHCDTCNLEFHTKCQFATRCRMSDLTKPHTLRKLCIDGNIIPCYKCVRPNDNDSIYYYHCDTCNVDFHDGCQLYLPEITHPFHSLHPLKLIFSSSCSIPSGSQEGPDSETEPHTLVDAAISDSKCKCCQKHLEEVYYNCSLCNFSLNPTCTLNPPPLTILNKKNHDHNLTFFPRRIPLPCDSCGLSLDNPQDHVYTCNICSYMVHRTCIYLPHVIKITRHPHRLSFSFSLPSGLFTSGVCRHPINVTCGQFSCIKGCGYAVHSTCGEEGRVWDGIDLEGVPEDPDEDKDIEPFVRIDGETIQHFSHEHHLKYHKNNNDCDEKRFCQACLLSILAAETFYSCIQCNFLLHEACASLPRKKDHPLHRHPLTLDLIPSEPMRYSARAGPKSYPFDIKGIFRCDGCDQLGCGFIYKCSKGCRFKLDIRCASLPDPIIHGSHSHELFFNFTQGECMGCKSSKCSPFSLECMQCKSFLGLKCASLPSLIHYKHDKHPLTLCYGEEGTTNGRYWCEICEATLDAKEWFYKCDEYCSVTVHLTCLLGREIFMKPTSLERHHGLVSILRNRGNTLAVCQKCHRRSTDPFLFKLGEQNFCTFHCLLGRLYYC